MLLATLAAAAHAQSSYTPITFTTFAGTGFSPGANDGFGTSARFRNPAGVAVDASGTIYVADTLNDMIRQISPSGAVTTIAGSPNAAGQGNVDGTGNGAKFNYPYGIAVDSSNGTLYVADSHNSTIRKITSGGVVTTLAGTVGTTVNNPVLGSADGTGSAASFRYPIALAVDSTGNVFVCDSSNSTIRKITPDGVVTTFAGLAQTPGHTDGMGSSARFTYPCGIAIDSSDNLYVSDFSDDIIRKITPAAVVTTIAGTAGMSGSADGIGDNARFNVPFGVAVDAAGNLYIADQYNHIIRKRTPVGGVSTIGGTAGSVGNTDGLGSSARFNYPAGVAVSRSGYLYIADQNNHIIRRALVGNRDHDLNGDGRADFIWQNSSTGDLGFWLMNGTDFSSWVDLGSLSPDWHVAASADFNSDGQIDLLWENSTTGERYLWFMNGTTFSSGLSLGFMSTAWHIAAVADFNSDGNNDILWENSATGDRGFWLMNGTTFSSWVDIGVISTALKIVGAADFNADGKPDIVWENTSTGKRVIWFMNGTTFTSSFNLGIVDPSWHIAALADYNGDGQTDILWENTSTGDRGFWIMNGTTFTSWVDIGTVTTDWHIAP